MFNYFIKMDFSGSKTTAIAEELARDFDSSFDRPDEGVSPMSCSDYEIMKKKFEDLQKEFHTYLEKPCRGRSTSRPRK